MRKVFVDTAETCPHPALRATFPRRRGKGKTIAESFIFRATLQSFRIDSALLLRFRFQVCPSPVPGEGGAQRRMRASFIRRRMRANDDTAPDEAENRNLPMIAIRVLGAAFAKFTIDLTRKTRYNAPVSRSNPAEFPLSGHGLSKQRRRDRK